MGVADGGREVKVRVGVILEMVRDGVNVSVGVDVRVGVNVWVGVNVNVAVGVGVSEGLSDCVGIVANTPSISTSSGCLFMSAFDGGLIFTQAYAVEGGPKLYLESYCLFAPFLKLYKATTMRNCPVDSGVHGY